jgi:G3E family GTPase
MAGASDRIPLSVVTGFLGSGKTTLIAALLKQPAMAGSAVIVNEIGAVGIDDAVFAQSLDTRDVFLLANGCLCCAASDDLASIVWALIRRPDRPRRIVIETSGLADPAPALRRLMGDPRLRQATRLDGLVATIDAVNGLGNLDDQPVAARQCAVADRRLITKTDLVDEAQIAALSARLRILNPGAPIEVVNHGAIDANKLFGASLYNAKTGRADVDRWLNLEDYRASHDPRTRAFLLEEERPVDWENLSARLGQVIARHGDRILRLKGVIRTASDPRPLVIHGVQKLYHSPVWLERWTRKPATSIVAIGDEDAQPAIKLIAEALLFSLPETTRSSPT